MLDTIELYTLCLVLKSSNAYPRRVCILELTGAGNKLDNILAPRFCGNYSTDLQIHLCWIKKG